MKTISSVSYRGAVAHENPAWKQALASIAVVTVAIIALSDNIGQSAPSARPSASVVRAADISARSHWTATGIRVESGNTYQLRATGKWTDFYIQRDADGFTSNEAPVSSRRTLQKHESTRRMPNANWFALVCAIGADESRLFKVGTGSTLVAAHSGELHCFANDNPSYYWNNRGSVTLTVSLAQR